MEHAHTHIKRHRYLHDGLHLSYLDNHLPSDKPPVILLHGFTASASINWLSTGWITTLSEQQRRVIALDARGHGESDKPHQEAPYEGQLMATDPLFLLEKLGIEQADFVGFSMGARMAAWAAILQPHCCRRLLLGGIGARLQSGIGNSDLIINALRATDLSEIKDRNARRFRRLAERGQNDLIALSYCIRPSRQAISDTHLAAISADTLILVGDEDDIAGDPNALLPKIARSQAKIVANANHFNALDNLAFMQTAIDFIQI